jgi:hypothetical protein
MDQKNLTIEWLLDNLRTYDDNWDFDSIQKTYRHLCALDNYYYADFLIWLADASYPEVIHALIENKGPAFFLDLLSDSRYSIQQKRALHTVINWYTSIFLPIIKGGTAPHTDPYEQAILALYRDRNFAELKKFLWENSATIFKQGKCRQMTSVFALLAVAQHEDFGLQIRQLLNGVLPSPLRSRRVVKLLEEHLDSAHFFGRAVINMVTMIHLLTKVARNQQCSYQAKLLALLYKKLGKAIEYRAPLRQAALEDLYAGGVRNARMVRPPASAKIPRIAICLAGQTRGTSACLRSLRDNVIAPLQADVFLSTWDKVAEWPGVFKTDQFIGRTFGAEAASLFPFPELNDARTFQATFPQLFATFSTAITQDFNVNFYAENFDLNAYETESEDDFLNDISFDIKKLEFREKHNQAKMFYKNYSVMRLLLEYEKIHDIKYDYIIRMRPDLRYNIPAQRDLFEAIHKDTVYLNYDYSGYGPDDNMWVAQRETMLKMCSIWPAMLDTQSIFIFKDHERTSHYLTAMWIGKLGLTSQARNMIGHKGYFSFKDMEKRFSNMAEALEKDLTASAAPWQSRQHELMKFVGFLEQNKM